MELLTSSIWQFIGVVVAVAFGILSIVLYLKQQSIKKLAYSIISDAPIFSINKEVEDHLEVLFKTKIVKEVDGQAEVITEKKAIKDAHLLIIEVWNAGNKEIKPEDYDSPVTFNFGDNVNILNADVLDTFPTNFKRKVILEQAKESLAIKPLLLNKKERIKLKILISDSKEEPIVDARIAGITAIQEIKRKEIDDRAVYGAERVFALSALIGIGLTSWFAVGFLISLIVRVVEVIFGINLPLTDQSVVGQIINTVIFVVTIIVTYLLYRNLQKIRKSKN